MLIEHWNLPYVNGGGAAGVYVFFTLSGFLITSLLIRETRDTGKARLRRFYLRRAERLFPALAFLLLVVVVVDLAMGSAAHIYQRVVPAALYFYNWIYVSFPRNSELGERRSAS